MPSTAIAHISYAPDDETLTVTFITRKKYIYYDVPADVAAAFRSATSRGAFFNRTIRDNYRFREVSGSH